MVQGIGSGWVASNFIIVYLECVLLLAWYNATTELIFPLDVVYFNCGVKYELTCCLNIF